MIATNQQGVSPTLSLMNVHDAIQAVICTVCASIAIVRRRKVLKLEQRTDAEKL